MLIEVQGKSEATALYPEIENHGECVDHNRKDIELVDTLCRTCPRFVKYSSRSKISVMHTKPTLISDVHRNLLFSPRTLERHGSAKVWPRDLILIKRNRFPSSISSQKRNFIRLSIQFWLVFLSVVHQLVGIWHLTEPLSLLALRSWIITNLTHSNRSAIPPNRETNQWLQYIMVT